MVGARFVVLKLKEVVRVAVLALIAIAAIIALCVALLPKGQKQAEADNGAVTAQERYVPGTYSARLILYNKPVDVLVTVSGEEIERIALSELEEAQEVFYPLLRPTLNNLAEAIITTQSTDVSTETNTMYTSKLIIDAVNNALSQAEPQPR